MTSLIQPVLFTVLNLLLLHLHGSAVPSRDLWISVVGLIGVLVSMAIKNDNVGLNKTKRFRVLFGSLTMTEVFVTLVLPWSLIYLEPENAYALSPHLFVFQLQIALEGIFFFQDYNAHLMIQYTILANAYRFTALMTWLSRVAEDVREGHELFKRLPVIAIGLWVCSTTFIFIEWYPLLKHYEVEQKQ